MRVTLRILLAASALILGCDRRQSSQSKTIAPTTAQQVVASVSKPTTEPSTSPASTQPAPSYIWIDQQPFEFPPARMVIKTRDDQLAAMLFSDDPPNAIDDDYHGNSFFFEMTPELADPGTIAGSTWDFKAPSSDRRDTTSGIFLEGKKKHLQPFEVHVEITGATSPITVKMAGTFLMFDTDSDTQPGKMVKVQAELLADTKAKVKPAK